jgi:hypothetical protein
MSGQSIRRSQFITTYGPGSIIEGPEGPRIVPTLERANIFQGNIRINDYELFDRRLSENLLGGAKIVSIPSNAQLGRPDAWTVYDTQPFPKWSLCVAHRPGILYRKSTGDARACPICNPEANSVDAWRKAGREKVRFIQVCAAGHMEDVDWRAVVTTLGGQCAGGCSPPYFEWVGSGGSLRAVQIRCPNCGGSANLGLAYGRPWRCSGAFAEEGGGRGLGCASTASMVQRGAANVFIPEIVSALTIPETALALHRLVGQRAILTALGLQPPANIAEFRLLLDRLVQMGTVNVSTATAILAHEEADISRVIGDLSAVVGHQTPREMRLAEYRSLADAAVRGYPRGPGGSAPDFEVIRANVHTFPGPQGSTIRISPVSRLRVVLVQRGYRRLDGLPFDRVATIDNERWYPGVELFGEGVFVDICDDTGSPAELSLGGPELNAWMAAYRAALGGQGAAWLADDPHWAHPTSVWWHTLSHRLISALSLDCGYSSAALRERVFVDVDQRTGSATGGILLYTVQPGGDGTLGGLISLVPNFDRILERAFRDLDSCSNDPLCGEQSFTPERVNGAACYACLFQSETACEHRNMALDRGLLLTNLP